MACPFTGIRHVSGFVLVPRTPLGILQKSLRRKAREICVLLCLRRTWERGCHLEYSIHSKELSSILLCHRIKKYPELASARFRIHSVCKNVHSGERIQKVADSYAGFTGYVWKETVSGKARSRLSDSGEGTKEWGRRKCERRAKSGAEREERKFLPFFFEFATFSISRTRLSRSLEQASYIRKEKRADSKISGYV